LWTSSVAELKGENPFKTRAYASAARAIESLNEPLAKIVAEDRVAEIKGVGEGIGKKIKELVENREAGLLRRTEVVHSGGLDGDAGDSRRWAEENPGPSEKARDDSIEKLEEACKAGKVASWTVRRKDAGQYLRGHRAPPEVCRETFAGHRLAHGRAVAGEFAPAS